jgi:hypothetical protein
LARNTMRIKLAVALTMVAVMAFAGGARADDKADVLAAAKSWGNALLDGDAKTVRGGSIGEEAELARWEGMSKMLASFQKLTDAMKAKFGDKADMTRMFQRPDFATFGDDTSVEVTGGEATLTAGAGKPPMKLRKDGGAWKVVLASMPAGAAKLEPKQMAPMTEAISATADEIKDGKYATYPEAMKALGGKMVKAKMAAAGAPAK